MHRGWVFGPFTFSSLFNLLSTTSVCVSRKAGEGEWINVKKWGMCMGGDSIELFLLD